MGSINSYKDLLIWQKGIILVVRVYKLVKSFPQEELYALTSQIKRAAVSIPSNISEGYGRNTDKSFSHFLDISRGSLNELETQLIIAKELEFITDLKGYNEILLLITEESKMINAFSKTLKTNRQSYSANHFSLLTNHSIMKIGLYFGTFNPIHVGHMIIANHMAEHSDLDQIWMVVTPHNPHKQKNTLLDDYQRLHLVNLATEDYPKIKPSDIEFKLQQPNYTVNTLAHLKDKYPQHEFCLIMGEDNLNSLHKWKNYEFIIENHEIYVYPRLNSGEIDEQFVNHPKIHRVGAPVIELSSTFIRESIKNKKNIRPLLPEKVWEYVDHNNFYRK